MLCVCFVDRCMFCRSLFVLLYFFYWPLCCLSFFHTLVVIGTDCIGSSKFNYHMITTLCMDKRLWQKHRTSQHVHNQLDRACRFLSLFVFLYLFYWPLCCLSFFHLQILITPFRHEPCANPFRYVWQGSEFRVMVFNATFNNISFLSWWSVLLVEETEYPEKPPTCRRSLTNFFT
jgi:hypothetical protein